ncbi:hypothetical protein GCM10010211_62930 [Streptomyces albospinus]|uniref:Uncharacterized protein n=1 Tax=Streptomyces albospinus TaxID=285515 RepID=A0ABQ2VHZ6_9ACTN|nr:hypothetical protein [Streptomyces albospinus]GGU88022.1 hypothetical protein GCM10010211_62930 [Streptomyces albospinus]
MSPHQPVAQAAGRAEQDARKTPPTMTELLAACAAASAVSTPPGAAEETRAAERDEAVEAREKGETGGTDSGTGPSGGASTPGRDAA